MHRPFFVTVGTLLLATSVARATPLSQSPPYPSLESEAVIGPVTHSPARDQGDVGFCWAYSAAGFMEGEALKQGKKVTLSPEYLGLHHLPNLLYQLLPVFDAADFDVTGILSFLVRLVVDTIVVQLVAPEGSISFSESLADVSSIGMVPESVFSMKFPLGKDANGKSVEIHPTLQERIQGFVTAKLLDKRWVEYYEKNPEVFRKDFFDSLNIHPPMPTDTFEYEGKTYTPITFMKNYLQFNSDDYQEVAVTQGPYQNIFDKIAQLGVSMNGVTPPNWPKPLTGLTRDQVLDIARSSIRDNRAVPIALLILEDQKLAESSGVLSNANCENGACTSSVGGHAILMTGMKQKADGSLNAVIIKNSWGDIGLNDHGASSTVNGTRGFFLVTPDYLASSVSLSPNGGWSVLVNKKYLPPLTN